jgi:3-hydroxyisobutyrate dehydrogenase
MAASAAVVGVGAMGAPIARRLISADYAVTVCDHSEAALAPFADGPATVTTEPAACAGAEIILILVATADQVRQVLLGEHGIASALDGNTSPLVAVMSTIGDRTVRDLQEQVAPVGLRLIDAPISGGPVRAEQGTLTVIMGGDAADIATARPFLECLGPNLFHCGRLGAGQTLKVANNILSNVNTLATAEVYRILVDRGLSLPEATQVLDVSTGRNWLSATPGEAATTFQSFTETREGFDSVLRIIRKDASLGRALSAESEGSFPVIEQVTALAESLGDETFDNWRAVAGAAEPAST